MKTLESVLNKDTVSLIKEHNANSKMNTFLYDNKDCQVLMEDHGIDRSKFLTRSNQIQKELIPYIHDNFHGIKCIVRDVIGAEIAGIIEHHKTREYDNRTLDNTVSFRRRFEDGKFTEPETIALWVVTNDKFTTHLYPCNQIYIE